MMTGMEEFKLELSSFHDAVLVSIDFLWAEGTVTFGVRTASGMKRIIVKQVTRLECAQEQPWGRSVCINEVRFGNPAPGAALQMEIEMQSGDVLRISGGSVVVDA